MPNKQNGRCYCSALTWFLCNQCKTSSWTFDPFAEALIQARNRVPLDPPVESTEMPETPQITTEIGLTYGEFQGIENKENPGSDPGIMSWNPGICKERRWLESTDFAYGFLWPR